MLEIEISVAGLLQFGSVSTWPIATANRFTITIIVIVSCRDKAVSADLRQQVVIDTQPIRMLRSHCGCIRPKLVHQYYYFQTASDTHLF